MLNYYRTVKLLKENRIMDKNVPYGNISTVSYLGQIIKKRRKELKATQTNVAGLSGVGVRYLSELERGKKTIELGKALQVIQRLGLEIYCVPRGAFLENGIAGRIEKEHHDE
jgi:y4mF family transcriptional regulator